MIPIRDDAPRLTFPVVTWLLIAVNVAVFVHQFRLGMSSPVAESAFVGSYAVVPANVASALTGDGPITIGLLPILTSMFLHGGVLHILGNLWFLRIFGDNVEDELGHGFFLLFYLVSGVVAALAQFIADPSSTIPMVGASGAIAGVMGAYLIRFPRATVTVLLPLILIWTTIRLPAFLMLTYWLAIQVYSGTSSPAAAGVAWWAHIGGFLAGVGIVLLRPRRRRWDRRWLT